MGAKKRVNLRGQISTEYIIIVGFILFIVIGILGIAFFYAGNITDRIKIDQVQNYGDKLISSSQNVYYAGEPSRVKINAYLPSGIQVVEINGNTIIINVTTNSGLNSISFNSGVPLSGALSNSEGVKQINVVATTGGVVLSE